MESALASASAISDERQKIEQYKHILTTVLASSDIQQAKQFIDHMLSDDVPLVVSRQLLQKFAQDLGRLEPDVQKEAAHYTLNQIQPRVVFFGEQVLIIRENLAKLYESEGQWSRAAQMLGEIQLVSGIGVDDNFMLSRCLKIARLYLEDDDVVNAKVFIDYAALKISSSNNAALIFQFKRCSGRFKELKRRISEDALPYLDIFALNPIYYNVTELEVPRFQQLHPFPGCTILGKTYIIGAIQSFSYTEVQENQFHQQALLRRIKEWIRWATAAEVEIERRNEGVLLLTVLNKAYQEYYGFDFWYLKELSLFIVL